MKKKHAVEQCGRCDAKPNSSGETARGVPRRNQESSSSWQLSGCFDCSQVRYRDGVGKHVKICVPAMIMGIFVILSSHGEKWLITCVHLFGVQIQIQVVITKRLLSQLYGQTDAALNSLSSTLLARQAVSPNICLKLPILFLIPLDHFQEGQVMYRTSPDCRKGWLWFFSVQVRKT